MEYNNCLISIIVPVYNAEKSIERCAKSLFAQTYSNLEYIFVNDHSTDEGISVLEKLIPYYPERQESVRILHHDKNQGVSFARNSGLNIARGDYFMQVDSDDWMESDMVAGMLKTGLKEDADLVWSDFYVDLPEESRSVYRSQNVMNDPASCIRGILDGSLHAGLWNKLFKREICHRNSLMFPKDVNMCEDKIFVISYLLHAKGIAHLNIAGYHYVQNSNSITLNRTLKSFESEFTVVRLLGETLPVGDFDIEILKYKARIKKNMFDSGLFSDMEFIECYPESDEFLCRSGNIFEKIAFWLTLRYMFQVSRLFLSISKEYSRLRSVYRF